MLTGLLAAKNILGEKTIFGMLMLSAHIMKIDEGAVEQG